MRPVFLIGFMGSGKSTLGHALAKATGLRFIDLDTYIESRCNATVREVFATCGENGFRDIERRLLHEVSRMQDTIVACGGGTPCFFDNMDTMNASGLTVYLQASHRKLHSRLLESRDKRPLISAMTDRQLLDYITATLDSRAAHYIKAGATFCADRLDDRRQIDESVKRFINQFMPEFTDTINKNK